MSPMLPEEAGSHLAGALDPDPRPEPAPGDRLAGVLVPLLWGEPPLVAFAKRADGLSRHPGEISFPGGLEHEEDVDLRATALREAGEEIALDPGSVEILGALPPVHTFVSGILIVPFVGMVRGRPAFVPDAGEIAAVLEYPLAGLAAAEATVEWDLGEHVYRGFAYDMGDHTIWGATARILHELIAIVRKETPWLTPQ